MVRPAPVASLAQADATDFQPCCPRGFQLLTTVTPLVLAALVGNEGIARFNEHVLADDRVECVLVPIRDGVTLIRRR